MSRDTESILLFCTERLASPARDYEHILKAGVAFVPSALVRSPKGDFFGQIAESPRRLKNTICTLLSCIPFIRVCIQTGWVRTMCAASVVHFGIDQSHRIPLLRCQGFEVAQCASVPRFRQLISADEFDAILVVEPRAIEEQIDTSRRLSAAPLIYFACDKISTRDARFDLVIEPLTRPHDWIESVRTLLEDSRRLLAESINLRDDSLRLRAESFAVREAVRANIEWSKRNRGSTDGNARHRGDGDR